MSSGKLEELSPVVNAMLTGDREGVGGILCNDSSGLLVASNGDLDPRHSGIYTNLTRLANKLTALKQGIETSGSPLVIIEADATAVLVKEYEGGSTVALRVPCAAASTAPEINGN